MNLSIFNKTPPPQATTYRQLKLGEWLGPDSVLCVIIVLSSETGPARPKVCRCTVLMPSGSDILFWCRFRSRAGSGSYPKFYTCWKIWILLFIFIHSCASLLFIVLHFSTVSEVPQYSKFLTVYWNPKSVTLNWQKKFSVFYPKNFYKALGNMISDLIQESKKHWISQRGSRSATLLS